MKHTPANMIVSLGQFATVAASSIATIITARIFGPDGRGIVTTLTSVTTLAAAVGILGLPTVILRQTGRNTGAPVPTAALAAIVATTAAFATIGSFVFVSQHRTLEQFGFQPWMYLLAIAFTLVQILNEMVAAKMQATSRFTILVGARLAWSILPLAAITLLAILGATPGEAFSGFALTTIAASAAAAAIILGKRQFGRYARLVATELQRLFQPQTVIDRLRHDDIRSAMGTHVGLTLLLLIYRVDVVILAILAGPRQVGLYSIAYTAAELVWMYVNGVSIVAATRFVAATTHQAQRVLAREIPRSLIASSAVVLVGLLSGPALISALLGASYRPSYTAFALMTPGIVAFVAFKLKATALNARGKSTSLVRLCGLLLIVNVGTNIALIPRFGACGAAAASSITYVLGGLLSLRLSL